MFLLMLYIKIALKIIKTNYSKSKVLIIIVALLQSSVPAGGLTCGSVLYEIFLQVHNLQKRELHTSNSLFSIVGDCCKCRQRIVGEGSGCTAVGRVYHISCFTCCHCDTPLQDKSFYSLDGNPYCKLGYLVNIRFSLYISEIIHIADFGDFSAGNARELFRLSETDYEGATGRPYHPHCFTCIVCHKSLDGITFTVDATNQIHCIEDVHK